MPLVLGLGLILSACAAAKPTTVSSIMRPPKHPAHGVVEPAQASAAPATAPAPATIWQSADKLLGLAPTELQAALGKPARIRDEEAGRIYQYIGSDCVLDLFLYPAVEGSADAFRVTYAEARSVTAEKKPVDACLKSLPAPVVADNLPSS